MFYYNNNNNNWLHLYSAFLDTQSALHSVCVCVCWGYDTSTNTLLIPVIIVLPVYLLESEPLLFAPDLCYFLLTKGRIIIIAEVVYDPNAVWIHHDNL